MGFAVGTLFRILVGVEEECILFSLGYLIPLFWSFAMLDVYMRKRGMREGVGDGFLSSVFILRGVCDFS